MKIKEKLSEKDIDIFWSAFAKRYEYCSDAANKALKKGDGFANMVSLAKMSACSMLKKVVEYWLEMEVADDEG